MKRNEKFGNKGEVAHYELLLFCHNVFKSRLLQMRETVYVWEKGLRQNDYKQNIKLLESMQLNTFPFNEFSESAFKVRQYP